MIVLTLVSTMPQPEETLETESKDLLFHAMDEYRNSSGRERIEARRRALNALANFSRFVTGPRPITPVATVSPQVSARRVPTM